MDMLNLSKMWVNLIEKTKKQKKDLDTPLIFFRKEMWDFSKKKKKKIDTSQNKIALDHVGAPNVEKNTVGPSFSSFSSF